MISVTMNRSRKGKFYIWAVALLFAVPITAAGQENEPGLGEKSVETDTVTMPGMRSMVPSLIGLGWDNFFLNTQFGLSSDQIKRLVAIREGFLIEERLAEQRAVEAELLFYEELGRDQVSWLRIKERIDAEYDLKGKLMAIHFHWLLRAINVLNHEQHQRIIAFLNSGAGPISSRQSRGTIGWPPGSLPLCGRETFVFGSCWIENGGIVRSQGKRMTRKKYQSAESDPM